MNGRVAGEKMKTLGEGSCEWPHIKDWVWLSGS